MNKVIAMLEEIMGLKIKLEAFPLGPGNPMVTTSDCSAVLKALGWKSKIDISNGLRSQVEWQKAQQ